MDNKTDIIVLTSVIIVLFLVFIIATVREFDTISFTKFVEKEDMNRVCCAGLFIYIKKNPLSTF